MYGNNVTYDGRKYYAVFKLIHVSKRGPWCALTDPNIIVVTDVLVPNRPQAISKHNVYWLKPQHHTIHIMRHTRTWIFRYIRQSNYFPGKSSRPPAGFYGDTFLCVYACSQFDCNTQLPVIRDLAKFSRLICGYCILLVIVWTTIAVPYPTCQLTTERSKIPYTYFICIKFTTWKWQFISVW